VATSAKAVKYLLHRARTFVFSTAPLPAVAYAAIAAIELARTMEKERNHIAAMAEKLRSTLRAAGWECGNSTTQIVPLMCRSEEEALRLSAALLSAGIHARAIRPPTVQKPRIRFSLHAAVTEQILERLVAALSAEALCL
ncbi:MAG: aminotransferase class I/II-fold pyridoxal phosphate-dependent enzyme, partial [Leptospiraceae bacterium]|nr:aminotransferase class I/II-fold pyridoxal phosphate-dependent enzyme [Leptospiraceae bacterium]